MSGTQPNAVRKRVMVTLTMTREAIDRADEIARRTGSNRSAVVERLVRDADMPRRSALAGGENKG